MLFNSYAFLLAFLPVTLAGFFLLGRRDPAWGAAWLVAASLAFYAWWSVPYVLLLLTSICFNYVMGAAIARAHAAGNAPRMRTLRFVAVAANLMALAYFKYFNFLLDNVTTFAGVAAPSLHVILPLGISFFTFTQIAFLIDASRGEAREYNPMHYALFVTYFPHLIAGPILHHKEMMPQFGKRAIYSPHASDLAAGMTIFAMGLCKKTLLADRIAPFVAPVFDGAAAHPPTLLAAWGAALAYTFQLYFDFSGYSDMAIGLSRMFGVQLPLNFDSPYKSRSIIEFWRRWHMTLSRFLRDYLYIPLGGSRFGTPRRYVNLFTTMLLGGLWHGAGWTFIAWGALHGGYLVVNHAWRNVRALLGWHEGGRAGRTLAWAVTFIAVVAAWVLFRATSFTDAIAILRGMAGANGTSVPYALASRLPAAAAWLQAHGVDLSLGGGAQFLQLWAGLASLAFIAFVCPNTQQIMRLYRPGLGAVEAPTMLGSLQWRPSRAAAIVVALLAVVGFLSLDRVSEFLYYQF